MDHAADDGILIAEKDTDPAVVTVTLNRPARKNAVSWPMWQRLFTTFRALALDSGVRVVVLTGAGGDFCSGADLASPAPNLHPLIQMDEINNVVLALHRLPKITIARVDGVAVGAGMNLALACDLVVASDRSRFAEIFVRRGLSIDLGGSWILPRLVGLHRAKELCLAGDIIDAHEAARIGLVNPSCSGAPPRSPGAGPAGDGLPHPPVTGAGPGRRAIHSSRRFRFRILPVAFCGKAS